MDEVSVTCSPEQITIFMCYSQPALSTTLVISQNQSGKNHGPGYKLRLIEQFLSFSSISSGDAADCTNDLSNFAISPSDGDVEATIIPIRSTAFSSQTPTAFSREPFRRELADTTADPDPDPDLESTPTQRALHRPNCSSLGDVEVIEKAASKNHGNENRASGDYLLKLLDSCDFDEGLAKEFKAMINMVKHINSLLFHGSHGPGEQIGPHRLRQIESVAEQVMHYFAKLGDKFDADLCRINEVRKGLPSLGHDVKPTFLRTNLNVWNLKIMHELAIPHEHDKDLFDSFSCFYNAQVYEAFAIPFSRQSSVSFSPSPSPSPSSDSSSSSSSSCCVDGSTSTTSSPSIIIQHNSPTCKNICNDFCTSTSLTDRYFTPISQNIGRVCQRYDRMMREMEEIGQAIRMGRQLLLTDEKTCRTVSSATEKAAAAALRRRAGKKSEGASWPKEGGGEGDSNLMGGE